MNKVILIGRLTKDIELTATSTNKTFCRFIIATDRYNSNIKSKEADFIKCIAWENNANVLFNYVNKGDKVALEGSIATGSYQDNIGKTVYTWEVQVNKVELISSNQQSNSQQSNSQQSNNQVSNNQANKQVIDYFKEVNNNTFDIDDISDDDLPF